MVPKNQIDVVNISKSYKTPLRQDGGVWSFVNGLVRRKFEYVQAVDDVSFSVEGGMIFALIGLNGAGKTTIIKMVSGIMKPDSGFIKVLGTDPFERRPNYKKQVALVTGQKGQLDPDLSVLDNTALYAAIYDIEKKEAIRRINEMAEMLLMSTLDLSKQVRSLSLGQRMKGELILSFLHKPTIVFLDEPTLGLDFLTQRCIRKYLNTYKRQNNASIILTSHDIDDITELADEILILDKGKSLYNGKLKKLKSLMPNGKVIHFNAPNTVLNKLSEKYTVSKDSNDEDLYFINCRQDDIVPVLHDISNTKGISNLNFSDETLDSIIEALYKDPSLVGN